MKHFVRSALLLLVLSLALPSVLLAQEPTTTDELENLLNLLLSIEQQSQTLNSEITTLSKHKELLEKQIESLKQVILNGEKLSDLQEKLLKNLTAQLQTLEVQLNDYREKVQVLVSNYGKLLERYKMLYQGYVFWRNTSAVVTGVAVIAVSLVVLDVIGILEY